MEGLRILGYGDERRIAGQWDWRCWVNDPAACGGRRVASLGAVIGVPACTAQGS